MTIKEALIELEGSALYLPTLKKILAFKMARESLEKADKYRWHDLRKDSEDLPKPLDNSIMYDCVLENHIYDASYPSFYFDDSTKQFGLWNSRYSIANGANEFITVDELGYEKIIAWKEIESFEEDEEWNTKKQ